MVPWALFICVAWLLTSSVPWSQKAQFGVAPFVAPLSCSRSTTNTPGAPGACWVLVRDLGDPKKSFEVGRKMDLTRDIKNLYVWDISSFCMFFCSFHSLTCKCSSLSCHCAMLLAGVSAVETAPAVS